MALGVFAGVIPKGVNGGPREKITVIFLGEFDNAFAKWQAFAKKNPASVIFHQDDPHQHLHPHQGKAGPHADQCPRSDDAGRRKCKEEATKIEAANPEITQEPDSHLGEAAKDE